MKLRKPQAMHPYLVLWRVFADNVETLAIWIYAMIVMMKGLGKMQTIGVRMMMMTNPIIVILIVLAEHGNGVKSQVVRFT
jgi:hypothetical protein